MFDFWVFERCFLFSSDFRGISCLLSRRNGFLTSNWWLKPLVVGPKSINVGNSSFPQHYTLGGGFKHFLKDYTDDGNACEPSSTRSTTFPSWWNITWFHQIEPQKLSTGPKNSRWVIDSLKTFVAWQCLVNMDPFLRDRNCQPRYPSSFGSGKDIDSEPSFGGKTWVLKRINHQKHINLGGATSKKNKNYIYIEIYTHIFSGGLKRHFTFF